MVDSVRMFQAATAVPCSLASYDLPYDIITVPVTVGLQSIMLPYATGYAETRYAFDLMSRGMGRYTRHIVNYLEQDDFDVLVSDFGTGFLLLKAVCLLAIFLLRCMKSVYGLKSGLAGWIKLTVLKRHHNLFNVLPKQKHR